MTHRRVKKQIVFDIKEAVALGVPFYKCCSEKYARELFLRIKAKRDLKGIWLHADNGIPMRGAISCLLLPGRHRVGGTLLKQGCRPLTEPCVRVRTRLLMHVFKFLSVSG